MHFSGDKSKFIADELQASRGREQESLEDLSSILNPPRQHFFEAELEKNIEKDVYYALTTSRSPHFFIESMTKRYDKLSRIRSLR